MERIIELNQEDKRVYPLSHSEGVLLSNTSEISLFESIYGLKDMVKLFSGHLDKGYRWNQGYQYRKR